MAKRDKAIVAVGAAVVHAHCVTVNKTRKSGLLRKSQIWVACKASGRVRRGRSDGNQYFEVVSLFERLSTHLLLTASVPVLAVCALCTLLVSQGCSVGSTDGSSLGKRSRAPARVVRGITVSSAGNASANAHAVARDPQRDRLVETLNVPEQPSQLRPRTPVTQGVAQSLSRVVPALTTMHYNIRAERASPARSQNGSGGVRAGNATRGSGSPISVASTPSPPVVEEPVFQATEELYIFEQMLALQDRHADEEDGFVKYLGAYCKAQDKDRGASSCTDLGINPTKRSGDAYLLLRMNDETEVDCLYLHALGVEPKDGHSGVAGELVAEICVPRGRKDGMCYGRTRDQSFSQSADDSRTEHFFHHASFLADFGASPATSAGYHINPDPNLLGNPERLQKLNEIIRIDILNMFHESSREGAAASSCIVLHDDSVAESEAEPVLALAGCSFSSLLVTAAKGPEFETSGVRVEMQDDFKPRLEAQRLSCSEVKGDGESGSQESE